MPSYQTQTAPRELRRCLHHRIIGGVAAGAADYFDVDPTTVRIALVILGLFGGVAVPLYLAAWILIPEEESETSIAEDVLHDHFGRA